MDKKIIYYLQENLITFDDFITYEDGRKELFFAGPSELVHNSHPYAVSSEICLNITDGEPNSVICSLAAVIENDDALEDADWKEIKLRHKTIAELFTVARSHLIKGPSCSINIVNNFGLNTGGIIKQSNKVIYLNHHDIDEIYREQEFCYRTQDAKRHLLAYLGIDDIDTPTDEDGELIERFNETFTISLDDLFGTIYGQQIIWDVVEEFLDNYDCNISENDQFQNIWSNTLQELLKEGKKWYRPTNF